MEFSNIDYPGFHILCRSMKGAKAEANGGLSVNDQEKLGAYMELYKSQWDRYDKRRDIEWKVTMGLWTGIAVLTGFLAGKVQLSAWDLWIYVLVWVIFSFVWTSNCWHANRKDRNFALVYLNCIERIIGHTSETVEFHEPSRLDFLKDWSRISQIFTTGVLMLFSWYLLHIIPVAQSGGG